MGAIRVDRYEPRRCDHCYVEFAPAPRHPGQRFCSPRCGQDWSWQQTKLRAQAERLAAIVPHLTGPEREVWGKVERLLKLNVSVRETRKQRRKPA
ncbi:hypothetical protein [Streptomyces sp. NBC_00212]|uniref:hypothetical protein n=1 Tax=Streptomyces sp. NBC_00212 TaxID=2975684 RepID=UPI00325540BB